MGRPRTGFGTVPLYAAARLSHWLALLAGFAISLFWSKRCGGSQSAHSSAFGRAFLHAAFAKEGHRTALSGTCTVRATTHSGSTFPRGRLIRKQISS